MTCEHVNGWTFCWDGEPPKDPILPCVVCGGPSTLLCDGVKIGRAREVAVVSRGPRPAMVFSTVDRSTCDEPLCEGCTTRPASGVIVLPDSRGPFAFSPIEQAKTERRRRQKYPSVKPLFSKEPDDTRDFCPPCAAALRGVL